MANAVRVREARQRREDLRARDILACGVDVHPSLGQRQQRHEEEVGLRWVEGAVARRPPQPIDERARLFTSDLRHNHGPG